MVDLKHDGSIYDKVMNKARFVYADTKSKDFKWHWEQGFIDQHNVFYTREEAMKIVLSNDQPFNLKRNGGDITKLYSEGLY